MNTKRGNPRNGHQDVRAALAAVQAQLAELLLKKRHDEVQPEFLVQDRTSSLSAAARRPGGETGSAAAVELPLIDFSVSSVISCSKAPTSPFGDVGKTPALTPIVCIPAGCSGSRLSGMRFDSRMDRSVHSPLPVVTVGSLWRSGAAGETRSAAAAITPILYIGAACNNGAAGETRSAAAAELSASEDLQTLHPLRWTPAALEEARSPSRTSTAPATLFSLAEQYRAHLRARVAAGDYSTRRWSLVSYYLASFLTFLWGDEPAGSLSIDDAPQGLCTAWLLSHYKAWKKGSTRADALGAVLGCFNWLEDSLICVNPFRRPRNLKFPRSHHRAMRKHHYRAIQRAARLHGGNKRLHYGSKQFRLIFFCAWHAGVRLKEFRELQRDEIDLEQGVIRLAAGRHKSGHSSGQERVIGLGPRLLKVLGGLCAAMKKGQTHVFSSPRGCPWNKDNLGRHYARYRKLAGVPAEIKMCALRHGYAVRILADGVTSAKAVADQLGHAGTRMVDSIYGAETRWDACLVREVARKGERPANRRQA
jgi:integrase